MLHILNIIAAIVGYGFLAFWGVIIAVNLYWHTHCTACYLLAEIRVLWRRKNLRRGWKWVVWLPWVFVCEWWRGLRAWGGATGSGGDDSTITWPEDEDWQGVTWHGPDHIFSIGRMVWHRVPPHSLVKIHGHRAEGTTEDDGEVT